MFATLGVVMHCAPKCVLMGAMRLFVPLPLLLVLLGCGPDPAPQADPGAGQVMGALAAALRDEDRGVRYAAILALGKGGVDPETLAPLVRDEHWCVRAEAQWWMERLAKPGRGADAAVDPNYDVPASSSPPALDPAALSDAVVSLKRGRRDARIRAAMALAGGGSAARAPLVAALRDPSWRVRAAVLRSLRAAPEAIAPFLRSDIVPEAEAARNALKAIGAPAAGPTATAMAEAHYGALHWGRTVFEHLGDSGVGGVSALAELLAHEDVNARETAARCLLAIGKPARPAAGALVRALHDPRLCVTANAALALGAIGVTREALDALTSPHARVRAYAALALGYALGTARRIDQVFFEHRLPVLDPGVSGDLPGPADVDRALARVVEEVDEDGDLVRTPEQDDAVLLRAIWSKRADVAIRSAAALSYKVLDARHAERVMELILPEGARENAPGDFEAIRSIIGSTEVPAYLMYVLKAGLNDDQLESIGGNFHRMALPWHLPVLAWFRRTHGQDVDTAGELWFSQWYSQQHVRVRSFVDLGRDLGPDVVAHIRAHLEDATTDPTWSVLPFPRWYLASLPFSDEDAPWLVAAAKRLEDSDREGRSTWGPAWHAVVRALGRLSDKESLVYLRSHADPVREGGGAVVAALARRGDRAALAELVRRATDSENGDQSEDLLRLMDLDPAIGLPLAVDLIAARAGPVVDKEGDEASVAVFGRWDLESLYLGLALDESSFLGLAEAIEPLLGHCTVSQLGELLADMPLCNTRAVATELFERLESEAEAGFQPLGVEADDPEAMDYVDEVARQLAPLHALDPDRLLRLLRGYLARSRGASKDLAASLLLRLHDRASLSGILGVARARLPNGIDHQYDGDWRHMSGKGTLEYLRRYHGLHHEPGDPADDAIIDVACAQGLEPDGAHEMRYSLYVLSQEDVLAMHADVLAGRLTAVRERVAATLARHPREVAEQLYFATHAGDGRARQEFWSILRTARYRYLHGCDFPFHRLRRDLSTLPHWIHELESNCCRVSDGLDSYLFEDSLGMPSLYGSESNGVGLSLSERALRWMRVMGADFVWCPLTDSWARRPE